VKSTLLRRTEGEAKRGEGDTNDAKALDLVWRIVLSNGRESRRITLRLQRGLLYGRDYRHPSLIKNVTMPIFRRMT
jgi:hypothetical protein